MNFGHKMGCHQMAERSFFIKGYQFPICARCTGVFLGEVLTIIALIMGLRMSYVFAVILLCVMGLDWGMQYIHILQSTNIRRLITGMCGGIGLTYFYYLILDYMIKIVVH